MLEMIRTLPFGVDGFFACACLRALRHPSRRQHVPLALAFGLSDACASALGAAVASARAVNAVPLALGWACLLALCAVPLSGRMGASPARWPERAILPLFLLFASADNLLAGVADHASRSGLEAALAASASFMLALLGLEAGRLARRVIQALPRARACR